MSAVYASGHKAAGICDICGFRYKLKELKPVVRNRVPTGIKACPKCWDPHHPQDDLGLYRVEDAQALRDPRPDHAELHDSRAIVIQVPGTTAVAFLGSVGGSVS